MASYTRLGSYLLATELASDPIGKVHRGLTITGSTFERHVLVRTFAEELLDAGLGAKLAESGEVLNQLAGARGFAANSRIEAGRTPHLVCDYIPGRSLAQVLEKTRSEQIPLGVDHALSVLQGIGQAIVFMHSKGLSHGVLGPHSVWVSFEGATHILDAPVAAAIQSSLGKARITALSLERYRRGDATPLQRDFYALGALLYELLTLDKLPTGDLLTPTLAKATLKAAQEDAPVPPEILNLIKRLLGVESPFESAAAFNTELERVLYDGDYSPTTFNMAFFMHTLFREENDQDNQGMKADQAADFTPFMDSEISRRSILEGKDGRNWGPVVFVSAAVLTVLLGTLGYIIYDKSKQTEKLSAELAKIQADLNVQQQKAEDLKRQEQKAAESQAQLEAQRAQAKTAEERKALDRQIEEQKRKQADLAKEREATERAQQAAQQKLASVQQLVAEKVKPKADQPQPAAAQPSPQPAVAQNKPSQPAVQPSLQPAAQPTPQVTAPTPTPTPAPTPSVAPQPAAVRETPVQVAQAAPTRFPAKAKLMRFEANQEHRVTVRVFVDAEGRPQKVLFTEKVGGVMGFDEAAQEAALATKYVPATRDGRNVAGWFTKTYIFPKQSQ